MKFIKFPIFFIFIFMFLISCMPNHDTSKYSIGNKLPEDEVNAYVEKMDKEFKTLGYKGLHLGMSHNHVNELVKNTYWCYKQHRLDKKENDPYYGKEISMGVDLYGPYFWLEIGSYGRGEKTYSYSTSSVLIKYYENKVVYIEINGLPLAANEIDRRVKNWGKFALKGLTEKYGPPTETYKSFDRLDIFDFESGYKIPVCYWDLGTNLIKLTIDSVRSKFGCSVAFENIEGMKEVKKEESSGKHAF